MDKLFFYSLDKIVKRSFFLFFIGIFFAAFLTFFHPMGRDLISISNSKWFVKNYLATTYKLFDIGVVDVNKDNKLDIYTNNHSAQQIFLVNEKEGKFKDQLLQLGIPQNIEIPNLLSKKTYTEDRGLYIYWKSISGIKSELVIKQHGIEDLKNIRSFVAQIKLPRSAKVKSKTNYDIKVRAIKSSSSDQLVELIGEEDGQIVIEFSDTLTFPQFFINGKLPLDQIYLGIEQAHPNSHNFSLPPSDALPHRDRHGMAWSDYDGDKDFDVFIVRGGMVGKMRQIAPETRDELLIQDTSGFSDFTMESGIIKDGCAARQVAWVDFDNDGLLDIYIACKRKNSPNQLHWQKSRGKFINVAQERGVAIPESDKGMFVWLDADSDGDQDLFWADNKNFWLYKNNFGSFISQLIGTHLGKVNQLTISDYDADGDLDIFVASKNGNTLLTNISGMYQVTKPESAGLPAKSFSANWVDYDNDGLIDLHSLPGGIYHQHPNHKFEVTHLLESRSRIVDVHSIWFDADNDGTRDLLLARSVPISKWIWLGKWIFDHNNLKLDDKVFGRWRKWQLILYQNILAKNHWLQLDITGPDGNHEAIGTWIKVKTPDNIQIQQVGQAEGSLRSQGHYRLYFGLGKYKNIDSVEIIWPDSTVQEIKYLQGDRLHHIQYDRST